MGATRAREEEEKMGRSVKIQPLAIGIGRPDRRP